MPYDWPSPHSKSPVSRYGFWLIIVCAVLIVTGAMNYNNTNHNPAAIPSTAAPVTER